MASPQGLFAPVDPMSAISELCTTCDFREDFSLSQLLSKLERQVPANLRLVC